MQDGEVATGAQLEGRKHRIRAPIGIPDEFELVVSADEKKSPCRIVWHSATIGVEFRPSERAFIARSRCQLGTRAN
jgi:hypothetical protein